MPQKQPEQRTPNYDAWTVNSTEFDHAKYVGTVGDEPVFYHADSETVFEADLDETAKEIVPDVDSMRELLPEESLGDYIDEIEDEFGWDSLSPFGESESNTDGE